MIVEEVLVTQVEMVIIGREQLIRWSRNNKLLSDLLLIVISMFESPRR